MDAGRRADRHVLAAVATVAVATGTVAVVAPAWMRARWARPGADEPERLYQAWGISTVGLGATVAGASPAAAAAAVAAVSIPWDLAWGGTTGTAAAVLNAAIIVALATRHHQ
jgi:hypothetical protein